ncbi:MAG: magnesium transporter CorA family protein, partial [Planctomycetales bacterium]|nr:magnesium transporter CorA family protein [Planctomycetales bacterium]
LKEQEELDPHKLSAFCGSNFLLTVHRHPMLSIRQVRARCGRHPESLLNQGVDVVLYSVIDTMVDNYLLVADRFENHLEHLEDRSFDLDADKDEDVLSETSDVRGELLELRRLAVAQRQLLLPVAKGEYDFVSETLSQRFSHVSDHLLQVIDTVDSMRETIVGIRDNYHTALTRRTNEIMKVLTIYAGILLPLSLIAGIYGMNLRLWPAQNHPAGFWSVLAGMSIVAALLFAYFRRRKWI